MVKTWDALQPIGTDTPTAPVILSLQANDARETGNQNIETPPDCGPGGLGSEMRFAFPELPPTAAELPAGQAPKVIWPLCGRPATARACAEVAETIYRRLQSNSSAIFVLTSPGEGDGKTSLMVALAPELAKLTGGVLAVDADFRKADLTSRLIFSAGAALAGADGSIYPTNQPGLNVLPIASGTELIVNSRGLTAAGVWERWDRDWFEELRERWPLVLLDTPSLEHAEAAPIARYCDGAYLVVRLGHTARRAVAEAPRAIHARGGRLLGSVIVG